MQLPTKAPAMLADVMRPLMIFPEATSLQDTPLWSGSPSCETTRDVQPMS